MTGFSLKRLAVPVVLVAAIVYLACTHGDRARPAAAVEDGSSNASLLDYEAFYFNAPAAAKPFAFIALVVWLMFLFTAVGITASDYFCPNLSTIASQLGLSESVTGVTFLAFSNGSPDVFSTFVALQSNQGSLAIGELVGAASFIVSVVVGVMCIIRPFQVTPHLFLRDVGFFLVAVTTALIILWDGVIRIYECFIMIGLYFIYVFYVGASSWYLNRRKRRDELLKASLSRYDESDEEYHDNDSDRENTIVPISFESAPESEDSPRSRRASDGSLYSRQRSRSRPQSVSISSAVRPSLLSAIEFRDVVNSLQSQSSARRSIAKYNDMARMLNSDSDSDHSVESYRPARIPRGRTRKASHVSHRNDSIDFGDPFQGDAHTSMDLTQVRSQAAVSPGANPADPKAVPPESPSVTPASPTGTSPNPNKNRRTPLHISIPPNTLAHTHARLASASRAHPIAPLLEADEPVESIPAITLTDDNGEQADVASAHIESTIESHLSTQHYGAEARVPVAQARSLLKPLLWTLFPSLDDFGAKSLVGKTTAILCIPAILLLNLTLPVVESSAENCDEDCAAKDTAPDRLPLGSERNGTEQIVLHADTDDLTAAQVEELRTRHQRELIAHEFYSHYSPLHHQHHHAYFEDAPPPPPVTETSEDEKLTRVLTAVQCFCAPIFIVWSVLHSPDADKPVTWDVAAGAACVGLLLAYAAYHAFPTRRHPRRYYLCYLGFIVAMMWIMTIIGEVVSVMRVMGLILGLSDAILGLTIFAIGNSLGDLVANATVARMGFPSMAVAACFGGPMLNLLLGVGMSGSIIHMRHMDDGGLTVDMKATLVVSAVGLLFVLVAMLIVVPLNGYWMSRGLGLSLISAYGVILTTNVVVEVLM